METKRNEKKKLSLAHICAYLSLVISITMLGLWGSNVGGFTVVSLDSFVGVIVTLLAIIVAVAIGYQIYNSIEMKNKIEELSALKTKFNEQEDKINQLFNKSHHLISMSYGKDALLKKDFKGAFYCFISSLFDTMQLHEPINYTRLLEYLEESVNNIEKGSIQDFDKLNAIQKCDKCIRQMRNYHFIKDKYAPIYDVFRSKIKN